MIYLLILLLLLTIFTHPKRIKRQKKLKLIVSDLNKLLKSAPREQGYAIKENIAFFEAIKTLPGYILWSLTRRRKIVASKLLEIADLSLPRWEKELYRDLDYVERKEFPGLSKPLRNLIYDYIKQKDKSVKVVDLGCGGMEVERQVLTKYKEELVQKDPVFIGIDSAPQAWDAINSTFEEIKDLVNIKKIKNIDEIKNYSAKKPTIIFYCGDALEIAHAHGRHFDMIISSRFRHHLNKDEKAKLDLISSKIANKSIEFDDYRSAFSWIAPVITAWDRPILLNGAIFSQIRQPWKKDLLNEKNRNKLSEISIFSPPGSYAKIIDKK